MGRPDDFSDTDSDLVSQAAAGDRSAIAELVTKHRRRLKQMVCLRLDPRVVHRVDPSDVIQEALVTASDRLPGYLESRPIPFYPWLRRIAWDTLVKVHQRHLDTDKRTVGREQRRGGGLSDNSTMQIVNFVAGGLSTPSAIAGKKEARQQVRAALEQLSEIDREVLIQRYVEQLTVPEIAAVMELSEAAAYKRHARALEKLRSLIEEGVP